MVARPASERTVRIEEPQQDRIGDYAVVDRVGSGGMATVWRVKGPTGKLYALKEMKPQMEAHREMAKRFKQEFKVASTLDHRNIVGVHDFFSAQNTMHIVMDWVDGLDLRAVLRYGGILDPGRLALIGAEIAAGLACAHNNEVLHRDLKPENVLLSKRGEIKVADFGVARIRGTRLTATGVILGSPAYMSPEQLAGVQSQDLDASTDIYGLGVLLYEMAEGLDPLRLKTHADLLVVLKAKREKNPVKMKKLGHDELSSLILEMLAPHPGDRPESMEEVGRKFRRIARSLGAVRADLEYLARVALQNSAEKKKASRRPAPQRPVNPEKEARSKSSRGDEASDAVRRRRVNRTREARATRAGGTRSRAGARSQAAARSAQWDGADATWSDADLNTDTSHASKVNELSVKKRTGQRPAVGVLSWAALILFALGMLFLGASASLTGSPLGLLEMLVPIP
jgi:serine/threonine protein kinase